MFVPGLLQIEKVVALLRDHYNDCKRKQIICKGAKPIPKWTVLPLHSTLTIEEQRRVFQRSSEGYRKIIVSTNIAESSVTVTDVKYGIVSMVSFIIQRFLIFILI